MPIDFWIWLELHNIRDCQDHIYCFLLLLYTKLMIPDMKYDLVAHYIVKKYLREQQPQLQVVYYLWSKVSINHVTINRRWENIVIALLIPKKVQFHQLCLYDTTRIPDQVLIDLYTMVPETVVTKIKVRCLTYNPASTKTCAYVEHNFPHINRSGGRRGLVEIRHDCRALSEIEFNLCFYCKWPFEVQLLCWLLGATVCFWCRFVRALFL